MEGRVFYLFGVMPKTLWFVYQVSYRSRLLPTDACVRACVCPAVIYHVCLIQVEGGDAGITKTLTQPAYPLSAVATPGQSECAVKRHTHTYMDYTVLAMCAR